MTDRRESRQVDALLGPEPRDPAQEFWDPEMQTMSRDALRALQDERLRDLVARIEATPVPLFRRALERAGITAGDVKSVDDLEHIPLTVKQDLRDSEAAHPPFGDYRFTDHRQCVRLGQSTGTTGTPTTMLWTRHDLWVEYESAARNWWRNGWRPGQVITHAHPAYLYGGGMMLSNTLEYFGLLNIWVPPPDTDDEARKGIAMWERLKPDVSFVSFSLGRFMEVAAKDGKELLGEGGLLPNFELHGGGGPGLPLMTAGIDAYAYAGGPCRHAPGGHVHEDWCIIEAVDPATGREVPDGQWGNFVITTLDRDNGLLRYDLEEAVMLDRSPCPCGETTIRAFWGGRYKDLLRAQGRAVQVSELEAVLRKVDGIAKPSLMFVVVQPDGADTPVQLRIERGETDLDDTALAEACGNAVREGIGWDTKIEILARDSLERSGYKTTRVVSE